MPNRYQMPQFKSEARLLKELMSESEPPTCQRQSKRNPSHLLNLSPSASSKWLLISVGLVVIQLISRAECASVIGSTRDSRIRRNNDDLHSQQRVHNDHHPISEFRFLESQNEYDGGASLIDDDGTLRLSLTIDDESGGLSAPSLHTLEPRVFLRVSGESGMIQQEKNLQRQNEVVSKTRASRRRSSKPVKQVLQFHRESTPISRDDIENRGSEEVDENDDSTNRNYHPRVPYIESYREKYVRPDPTQFEVTTPRTTIPSSNSPRQEWSDIIAQVTTPSSFNEINSSASEHRLADFHFRTHLPSYFSHKYSSYSEEDLENVADLDDELSKYFVKTRPRSVTTAGSNIYSNFYYEPPSFSTKSVPIPVKTNKEKIVFASVQPTQSPHHYHVYHDHHDLELPQQDSPIMTTISSNFTDSSGQNNGALTDAQIMYHVKEDIKPSKDSITKTSASSIPSAFKQNQNNYFENEGNLKNSASNNPYLLKSSAETLDVSTSQSILSKVTLNIPHHPQFVIIKSDPHYAKTAAAAATPRNHNDEIVLTSIKLASPPPPPSSSSSVEEENQNNEPNNMNHHNTPTVQTTTEPSTETTTSTTQSSITQSTTTDATSIPGIPGVDYPTLGEIPQTSFDCKNQRYKGFFADIDTKCQAWHYCDFTDSHSTFLCPNGTLFSQVLLTCDWWFNVDCKQARQLYVLNERLYRYIKPPKPSFPEDFIGEHVDKWLLQQYTNGYLPKVRKKSKAKFVNLPPPPPPPSSTTTEIPPTKKED